MRETYNFSIDTLISSQIYVLRNTSPLSSIAEASGCPWSIRKAISGINIVASRQYSYYYVQTQWCHLDNKFWLVIRPGHWIAAYKYARQPLSKTLFFSFLTSLSCAIQICHFHCDSSNLGSLRIKVSSALPYRHSLLEPLPRCSSLQAWHTQPSCLLKHWRCPIQNLRQLHPVQTLLRRDYRRTRGYEGCFARTVFSSMLIVSIPNSTTTSASPRSPSAQSMCILTYFGKVKSLTETSAFSTEDVPGLIPNSPPNCAAFGPGDTATTLQGTPEMSAVYDDSTISNFTLGSFFYGCVLGSEEFLIAAPRDSILGGNRLPSRISHLLQMVWSNR